MSTVRQIAKEVGVSIATVSRVLNNHPSVREEVREKVLAAVNSHRYVSNVGKRETLNIAYVFTGESSLGSPYDAAVLEGVYSALADSNLNLMILDLRRTRRNGEDYSQMFQRLGVRGAILRTTTGSQHTCRAIAEQGFPAIVVGSQLEGDSPPCIVSESRFSSREAVNHLIGLGHRQIGVCVNVVDDFGHTERLMGYGEALSDHGLEFDDKLVMRVHATPAGGAQIIRRLMTSLDRPTAVYITDPITAVAAMHEARKVSLRIPEDLSIVGFDDTEMRHQVLPAMTSVCQNAYGLGNLALQCLSQLIDGKDKPTVKPDASWFEVHGSTGPPPEGA